MRYGIKEGQIYGDVSEWLATRLRSLYPGWKAKVFDTSRVRLSNFLAREGLTEAFPGYEGFEIEVDVTAVLRRGVKASLAFVECKVPPITLRDVGQILGYSRVAGPVLSLIVSPSGISNSLGLLLNTFNRVDLLEYGQGRRLKIATWDLARGQVDPLTVLPPGELG